MKQRDLIKKYLQEHPEGMTSLDAFANFGATRLSGIIYSLKHKDNLNIITEIENVKTRYKVTPIARYKLVEGVHHETF